MRLEPVPASQRLMASPCTLAGCQAAVEFRARFTALTTVTPVVESCRTGVAAPGGGAAESLALSHTHRHDVHNTWTNLYRRLTSLYLIFYGSSLLFAGASLEVTSGTTGRRLKAF